MRQSFYICDASYFSRSADVVIVCLEGASKRKWQSIDKREGTNSTICHSSYIAKRSISDIIWASRQLTAYRVLHKKELSKCHDRMSIGNQFHSHAILVSLTS